MADEEWIVKIPGLYNGKIYKTDHKRLEENKVMEFWPVFFGDIPAVLWVDPPKWLKLLARSGS